MATPGLASAKALPAAIEMGSTVDEPDTKIEPDRSPSPSAGASRRARGVGRGWRVRRFTG